MTDAGRPQLLVVAGPNGSGKTSWLSVNASEVAELKLSTYLNPDMLARELSPGDAAASAMAAGREIIRRSLDLLSARLSFGFETTLAGHHALGVLRDAQEVGYEITLVFVATSDPGINVKRVAERHARGGHDIAEADIIRRYRRSFDNLEAAMGCADHVRLIDNSVRNVPHEYARFDSGFVAVEEPVPEFGRAAVSLLVERAEKA